MISSAQRRLLLLTATFALSLLSCGREVTGPENGINYGRARFGAVSLDPQMPSLLASLEGAGSVVPFERVRVVLRRLDGAISVDTVVNFPVGADSLTLSLLVPIPLDAPLEGLALSLTMAYMNAAGDTVFRGGPVGVIAPPLGSSAAQQPITIPVVYDGVGKNAARVAISPKTATRVSGTSTTFTATAFDGQNAPIANTPLVYFTLDSSRASVPNAATGQVTWLASRGTARIVAALPNGLRADTAFVTIALPASQLVVQSGNTQSGSVGSALTAPVVLRTLASDNVPVAGVIVNFAVATGGGSLSALVDTSDVNGEVSANWTLGAAIGAQSLSVTSLGLTGSPATVSATATAGTPTQVRFTQVPTAAVAGAVLAPAVTAAVRDAAGNLVTTFTGPVTVTLPSESTGPITGTTTANAVAGVATFANLSLNVVGSYQLIVTQGTLSPDTSAVITVTPGAGTQLEFVSQPVGAVAGIAFAPPVTVIAKDTQGNIATGFTGTVTLALLNASGATLGGSISVAAINGLATFSSLTADRVGATYALSATSGALVPDTSAVFGISAAVPANIVLIAGGAQSGPAGQALAGGIVMEVRDAFGNITPGVTVNFVSQLGGGSPASPTVVTDVLGRAATTWVLGPLVGTQTLRALLPGFSATLDISATATVGTPTQLVFVAVPTAPQVAGQPFNPPVVVQVRDAGGNVVTNYSEPVAIGYGNNPTGAPLLGTLLVNAVNGVATFPGLSIELAEVGYTLQAASGTLPLLTSTAFDVVATTASAIAPVAGDAQSALAGALLPDSITVRVTDQFGNKVAGVSVVFSVGVGAGSIAPSPVTTDVQGEARTAWTLGSAAGVQSIIATIPGGANVTLTALATAGAGASLTVVSGGAQTGAVGTALTNPIVFRVADVFGNPVSGAVVTWSVPLGSGSTSAPTSFTNAAGEASVTWTLGDLVGVMTLGGVIDGSIQAAISATAAAGAATNFTIVSGANQTGAAGSAFTDTLRVRLTDTFGNPIAGATSNWTALAGATSLASATALTDANGVAFNTGVFGATVGATNAASVTASGIGSPLFFAVTITTGAAQTFEFTSSPATGIAGGAIAGIVIAARDAFNNAGAAFDSVTIVVDSGPAGAVLSGTTTRAAVTGAASFSDLRLNLAGTYRIRAQRGGITSAVSSSFVIAAGAATTLSLDSGDSQSTPAGSAFALPLRVRVTDASGNTVAGAQVSWSGIAVSVAPAITLSDANGIAEVIATADVAVGLGSVTATLVAVPTEFVLFDLAVDAGAAAAVAVAVQPADGIAGTVLNGFAVRANDAFGNLASGFVGPVTLRAQLMNGTPVNVIVQGDSVGAASGIATFIGTRIDLAGTYRLLADFGALGTVLTDSIVISPAGPSTLAVGGGNGQSAPVTQALAAPLQVIVTDAFGNGVAGVNVNWGVVSGSAEFSDTVTVTTASGLAQTTVTLGSTSGSVSIGAFAAGLSGSPASFTATATAGTPFGLITVSGDAQSAVAGTVFADSFVGRVVDGFGNGVSGVDVTFDLNSGASALSDTVVTSDANGLVSVTATAATTAGSGQIDASASGISPTSFSVTITAGASTQLVFTTLPLAGTAGVTYNAIQVSARDVFGNLATGYTDSLTISIGSGPLLGTIGGTTRRETVAGVTTFDNLVFTVAGDYDLQASYSGSPTAFAPTITINAAAGALLAVEGIPTRTGAASSTIVPSLTAKITDAFGNPVSGETVSWAVVTGDITLSAPTSVTNAFGVASVDVLAGPTAGSAAVTASNGTLTGSPVSFPITVTAGAGTQLTVEIGPVNAVAGDLLTPFTVAVRDAGGNVATGFVGNVTIAVDSGPSLTIAGVTTEAVSTGAATFAAASFETAGQYRLRFSGAGLTDAVSGLFSVSAGAAANLVGLDGDAQSDTVALALDLPLRVRVTDAFGNSVSGQSVAWAPIGLGAVAQDTTVTDANGVAQVGFTLGTASGGTTMQASVTGLTGSPVGFSATAIPGGVTSFAVTSPADTVVAGNVGAPITVEARDAYGNLVTWFTGNVNVVINVAPAGTFLAGTTTQTAVGGIATFSDLAYQSAGSWFIDFVSGAISFGHSVEVIAGAPANVAVLSGDAQSGVVTLPLPLPLQVRVSDTNNNPIVGDTVVFQVTQGGGTLSSATALDTAITNLAGIAQTTWTLGSDSTITHIVQANRTGFATLSFTATPLPFVANRTWTGDVDTSILNSGNWIGGLIPAATDSVLVPSGRPNYPVLTSNIQTARLTVASGATIALGPWVLFVDGSTSVLPGGTITSIDTGAVALQGASGGTVRGSFPRLVVSNGNYSAIGSIQTATDLQVIGSGQLDLQATTSTVARDLAVSGAARLVMNAAPDLTVERDATFSSTNTTTGLDNGTLRVRRSFTANSFFRPAAGHVITLDGAGTQNVQFTLPDSNFTTTCLVGGCFGTLLSPKSSGGLVFLSSAKAIGGMSISGDTLGAAGRTLIGVGSMNLQSAVTTVGRAGYTTNLQIGLIFLADTLVAFGGNGTTPLLAVGATPSVVSGSYALGSNHPGPVTVTGVLDIDGPGARIGGNLITAGSGRIRMTNTNDSLSVGGAQLGGITDSTFLAAGVLEVRNNFSQVGSGVTTYAAQSGHRLRMSAANPIILFADPLLNPIGSLRVNEGSTLTIDGLGARITGLAVLDGTTAAVAFSTAEVVISGGLVDSVGNRWSVQTTRFQGANPVLPLAINSDLLFADAVTLNDSLNVTGGVRVTTANGLLTLNGRTLRTAQFSTDDSGRLDMSSPTDLLFVAGTAAFEGGTSVLTDGRLEVGGDFIQSVTPDAFAAAPAHETWLTGGTAASITFANGGLAAGQSHFGTLRLNKGVGQQFTFASNVFVAGVWETTPAANAILVGDGAPRVIVTRGAAVQDVSFTDLRWELLDGAAVSAPITNVGFGTMAVDVPQFRVARAAGTIELTSVSFATTPTTGVYVEAEDTNTGDADTLIVLVSSPSPAFHGGKINFVNAQLFGWDAFVALNWTNAGGDRDWFNTANWAQGVVPGAADSVFVSESALTPIIGAPVTIRALASTAGSPIEVSDTLTVTRRVSVNPSTGMLCNTGGALVLQTGSDSVTVAGSYACLVIARNSLVRMTSLTSVDSLRAEGAALVNPGAFTLNVAGDFTTLGNAALIMTDATGNVEIGGTASFLGTALPGAMTAGTLGLLGDFLQVGNPNAFQADAGHTTRFSGELDQVVLFTNPDSSASGSHFGSVQIENAGSGITVGLASNVFMNGELRAITGLQRSFSNAMAGGATITSRGANVSVDLDLDGVRWAIGEGNGLAGTLSNVRFTNQPEGITQLSIARNGGSVQLSGFQFDSLPVATTYLAVTDVLVGGGGIFTVDMLTPTPAFHGGRVNVDVNALLNNWNVEPGFIWTGALDATWSTPANWSDNIVPNTNSIVTIPQVVTAPATAAPVAVRRLLLTGASTGLQLGDTLFVREALQASLTANVSCVALGRIRFVPTDSAFVQGTISCPIDVLSGVVAQNGNTSITGAVAADSEGRLAIGAFDMFLASGSSFSTNASGTLSLTDASGSLTVNGPSTFAGAATTGLLTAGQLIFGGDVTQGGGDPAAFDASSTIGTTISVSGSATVSIADPTSSGFGTTNVAAGTMTVAGTVPFRGAVNVEAAGFINGAGRMEVPGDVTGPGGMVVSTLWLTGNYARNGTFQPDTVIFAGTGQSFGSTYAATPVDWRSIVVEGTASAVTSGAVTDTLKLANSLIVRGAGARLTFDNTVTPGDSLLAHVSNSLVTLDGGTIEMAEPGISVRVGDFSNFAGGDQTGLLTEGRLILQAGFRDTVPNAFVATGAHLTVIGGCGICDGIPVQNTEAAALRFASLRFVNGPSSTIAASFVADTAAFNGNDVSMTGLGTSMLVNGDITGLGSATLNATRVALGGAFVFDGAYNIDTLALTGINQRLRAKDGDGDQIPYQNIDITGTTQTLMSDGDSLTVNGVLRVATTGNLRFGEAGVTSIARLNTLVTDESGTVEIQDQTTTVRVIGVAFFGGGSTAGMLDAGTFEFYNGMTQTGSNSASAFSAGGSNFSRVIMGAVAPMITFANPGSSATDSHFGHLWLVPDAGTIVDLASNVFVASQLVQNSLTPIEIRANGAPYRELVSDGASISLATFRGVNWEITGGTALASPLSNLSFVDQDPTITQFAIRRPGTDGSISLVNPVFATPPTSGNYLEVEDVVADANVLTVDVTNPTPGFHSGLAVTLGGAILTGWSTSGPGVWLGTVSSDFNTAANWQSGVVPLPTDSISIDDGASQTLTITSPTTIGAIRLVGFTLELQDTLFVTGTTSLGGGTTTCSGIGMIRVDYAGADSVALSVNGSGCAVDVFDGRVYLDAPTSISRLLIDQTGIVDVNGSSLTTTGDLRTAQSALLVMTDNADTVRIGGQGVFQGGDETGQLTAGAMVIGDSFLQGGSSTAFASSGTLRVFLGDSTSVGPTEFTIDFNNPLTSPINQLTIFDMRTASKPASVSGELRLVGGATLTGLATTVGGGLRVENSAAVTVDRLALAGQLYIQGTFAPDTFDLLGAGATLQQVPAVRVGESQLTYGVLRVLADSAIMQGNLPYRIANKIEVGANALLVIGDAAVPENQVTILADTADLSIEGDGRLRMLADGALRVRSASFNGGDHNGMLTRGDLVVHGDFTQLQNGATTRTFVGSERHRVVFDSISTISLANPADARFSKIALVGATELTLLSDLFVDSTFAKQVSGGADVVIRSDVLTTAPPRLITARGTDFSAGTGFRTFFHNVALRLEGDFSAGGGSFSFSGMSFEDMDPASTYLDVNLLNYFITSEEMDFTTPVTTGKYFNLADASTTIAFQASTPAVGCINAVENCVGPRSEPSAPEANTWLGLTNDWTQPTNWSLNAAPSTWTDVTVPVTSADPVLGLDKTVRNLSVQAGATLTVVGSTLNINGTTLDVQGTIAQSGSSFVTMHPPGVPTTISGGGVIASTLSIAAPSSGSETTVTLTAPLTIGDSLTILANTLVLGGQDLKATSLSTSGTGSLQMTDAADSLEVGDATFNGGSTEGLLTNGQFVVRGDFSQGGPTPTSFAASNSHVTMVSGSGARTYTFANPAVNQSHFATLRVLDFVYDDTLKLASDIYVNGPLQTPTTRLMSSDNVGINRLLSTFGFSNAGGISYFNNLRLATTDSAGISFVGSTFFYNMDLTVPQLSIVAAGGTVNIAAVTFTGLGLADAGKYIFASDNVANASPLTINVPLRSPEGHEGHIQFENGAILTGWDAFAQYVFTGAQDGAFSNPLNWDVGIIPTATSNVVVANASGATLVIASPLTVKKLTMGSGATSITLQDTLYTTGVQGGFDLVSGTKTCVGNGVFVFNDPSPGPTWLRADLPSCDLVVQQGNVNLSGEFFRDTTNVRDLTLAGGIFNVRNTVNVSGDLQIVGSGYLSMSGADDSLVVAGSASFRGASTILYGGDLVVFNDLDVGAGSDQFIVRDSARLSLGNPDQSGGTRSITIDPSAPMYVDSLTIYDGTTTITGQLNVHRRLRQVTSTSNTLTGGTIVLGDRIAQVAGALTTDAGSILTPRRVELYGNITSAGDFSPDTVDFTGTAPSDFGGIQRIRSSNSAAGNYGYKLVRVFADANMRQVSTGIPIAYTITEGLQVLNGQLTIGDSVTLDTVYVNMATADLIVDGESTAFNMRYPSRVNADSSHFQGGFTSVLTSGRLRTRSLVQQNATANTTTLQAVADHVLDLAGVGTVSLENWPFNTLNDVRLEGNAVATLGSELQINGTLGRVAGNDGIVTMQAANPPGFVRYVYAASTDFGEGNSGVVLKNVPLLLEGTFPGDSHALNNVTFQDMDPLSSFLIANFSGQYSATFNNLNFNSPVGLTGRHFDFQAGDAGSVITFVNASPAAGCLASFCVPSDFSPTIEAGATWVGGESTVWTDPSNWSTSSVPTAGTDVLILSGTIFSPEITSNTGVKSLGVGTGATMNISAGDTLTVYGDVLVDGTVTGTDFASSSLRMRAVLGGSTLSGAGSIASRLNIAAGLGGLQDTVRLTSAMAVSAPGAFIAQINWGVYVSGGVLDLNGWLLTSLGRFQTEGTGALKMTNPSDVLDVRHTVNFWGGSTAGLLTEGLINVQTSFTQMSGTSALSFAPSGNHTVRFSGVDSDSDVEFDTPDSTLSHFANLQMDKVSPRSVNFYGQGLSRYAFAENITSLTGDVFVDYGALIVTGAVAPQTGGTFFVYADEDSSFVRLLGVDQSTCDGRSFAVTGYRGRFEPTACHTATATWTQETVSSGSTNLNAVWAGTGTFAVAVGDGGVIHHYGGTAWVARPSPTLKNLYAVWGRANNDVYAVGDSTVIHWDGTLWTTTDAQLVSQYRGVSGGVGDTMIVVGDGGIILTFDGSAWSVDSTTTTANLTAIYRPEPGEYRAVGSGGTVLRSTGSGWTQETSRTTTDLLAYWAADSTQHHAFGVGGVRRMKNGFNWRFFGEANTPSTVRFVGGTAALAYAVGDNGMILRKMDESFTPEVQPITNVTLRGVASTSAGTSIVVGDNGTVLRGSGGLP